MTFKHLAKFTFAIAAAALLSFLTFNSAAAAPLAGGGCDTTATKFKVSAADQMTGSNSYIDINETKVTFKQGGTRAGCVIVTFAAEARADTGVAMVVQAVLDGVPCTPADVAFVPNSAAPASSAVRSMTFVCLEVEPGNHAVQMQYHLSGGGTIEVGARTTAVQYLK